MKFWLLFSLIGCEMTPNYVDSKDIEQASTRQAWPTVCKGLEMSEERIRRYAAETLLKHNMADEDRACICEHIQTPEGGYDSAIAEGLQGSDNETVAACFGSLVQNQQLNKRLEAVIAFARLAAPSVRQTLATIALAPGDLAVRVRATDSIGGDPKYKEALMTLLDAPEKELRAGAATGLSGHKDKAIVAKLIAVATKDPEGEVRAKALVSVKRSGVSQAQAMVCTAMLDDEPPAVREAAVRSFKGTRRDSAVKCLRTKAFKEETDATVRDALLAVLKSSPNDNAALVLCDAIPFWMRTYVKDDIPDKIPGTMIVKTQNDRDWKRSYECFQRAYSRSSGYSCFAKMHVGLWFREVGGKNYVPSCPGYENTDDK